MSVALTAMLSSRSISGMLTGNPYYQPECHLRADGPQQGELALAYQGIDLGHVEVGLEKLDRSRILIAVVLHIVTGGRQRLGHLCRRLCCIAHAELGLQWTAWGQRLRATVYNARVSQEIDYDTSSFRFENVARTRNRGLELSWEGRIAGGEWRGSLTSQNPVDASTGAQRLHCCLGVAVSGDHGHRRFRMLARHQLDEIMAVAVRQAHIGETEVVAVGTQQGARFGQIRCRVDHQAQARQRQRQSQQQQQPSSQWRFVQITLY